MRPPRYKLAVINWLAIFPLITLILWLSRPLMAGFPLWTTTLVVTLVLVPLMTFLVMPLMLRIFARWLAPRTTTSPRPDTP
jgi:antibiotic biosynthesis monooxygenase (ABM) superfamily enzyme